MDFGGEEDENLTQVTLAWSSELVRLFLLLYKVLELQKKVFPLVYVPPKATAMKAINGDQRIAMC